MRFLLLPALLFCITALSQGPSSVQLGDSTIHFNVENPAAKRGVLFINVHENEATSIQAVKAYDVKNEFPFIYLHHNGTRRIFFNMDSVVYSVDPNRIFSRKGVLGTIQFDTLYHTEIKGGTTDTDPVTITSAPLWNVKQAAKMTKNLAKAVLQHMKGTRCVISLHNNTPDNYSILSYLPGMAEAPNAKEVYVNEKMDPDDFIYTTSQFLYTELKSMNINVILQDNKNCIDDGSLSVYCGKHGIPYANVEAEEGHLNEQVMLIEKLVGVTKLFRD